MESRIFPGIDNCSYPPMACTSFTVFTSTIFSGWLYFWDSAVELTWYWVQGWFINNAKLHIVKQVLHIHIPIFIFFQSYSLSLIVLFILFLLPHPASGFAWQFTYFGKVNPIKIQVNWRVIKWLKPFYYLNHFISFIL